MSDFENPDCTGDFPEADLPDLMLLGEAAATMATSPSAAELVTAIGVLRTPLSAIRGFVPA